MRRMMLLLLAVWVIRYDLYSGGNTVPCAGAPVVKLQDGSFQQPLCQQFRVAAQEWPVKFRTKAEAETTAKVIAQQGGATNLRVERVKK